MRKRREHALSPYFDESNLGYFENYIQFSMGKIKIDPLGHLFSHLYENLPAGKIDDN